MISNFFKGFVVGIFNIIPGISGCAFLVILGLYDKCIFSISNIFNNPKKSFLFLFPIGIGIILGTFLFSKIILFFITNYTFISKIVFFFLILATFPKLITISLKNGFKYSYLFYFFISFFIGFIFLINSYSFHIINNNFFTYFFSGFILSFSTIIPGISSTCLLTLFGLYNTYLYSISSFSLSFLIPTFIFFLIFSYFISKAINYLINDYYGYTYFSILGFSFSTLFSLII